MTYLDRKYVIPDYISKMFIQGRIIVVSDGELGKICNTFPDINWGTQCKTTSYKVAINNKENIILKWKRTKYNMIPDFVSNLFQFKLDLIISITFKAF